MEETGVCVYGSDLAVSERIVNMLHLLSACAPMCCKMCVSMEKTEQDSVLDSSITSQTGNKNASFFLTAV